MATSPAMAELTAALRAEGLLPFVNYHRLHVVPPCTISDAEATEALERLDRALAVADAHTTSA
jgi:taurine--2-oxoglutarate transaminase